MNLKAFIMIFFIIFSSSIFAEDRGFEIEYDLVLPQSKLYLVKELGITNYIISDGEVMFSSREMMDEPSINISLICAQTGYCKGNSSQIKYGDTDQNDVIIDPPWEELPN